MIARRTTINLALILVAALGPRLAGQAGGQNPEELARRHYELGLGFVESAKYTEALKDFQAVVDSYPNSAVAGDALVEIARYYLEVARDAVAAQTTTDIILKKYSSTDAAATAYVLSGRIALDRGRAPADIDTALASFERVPSLFPGSDVVPSSIFYAGEALRLVRRNQEALERYQEVTLKYPTSVWAARALIGAAVCLTHTNRPVNAMEALQRVRTSFPGTPEATTALNWNTILYRLYIRPPSQIPYTFSGRMLGGANLKFKDVIAIALDAHDNVMLAHKTAVAVFDNKGSLVRSIASDGPTAIAVTPGGLPVVVGANFLTLESAQPIGLAIPQADGRPKPVDDIPAIVVTSRGDWIVADRKMKALHLFSAPGKYVKQWMLASADRLAMNAEDDLAVLDRDSKTISVFDRDAKPIGQIVPRASGYELDNPVDITFDTLGHLYVLDRSKATVFVFSTELKLIVAFSIPEKNAGSFEKAVALGLDSAARLFIFDDRAQHVLLYQ